MDRRLAERKNQFKKCFDDPRRKREDLQVQIRRLSREQNLMKKRINGLESSTDLQFNTQDTPNAVIVPPQQWQSMVEGVMSSIPERELECTQFFRKILSIEKKPPIQEVIDAAVVPKFVEFLQRHDGTDLQFEAAWALTNIASGTTKQTQIVVSENAVPIFVSLLSSSKEDVREQAIWALGNIAGDCPTYRDLILRSGGLTPLLQQLRENDKLSMLRNATWTLSNLCRGKPPPPFEWVSPSLDTLKHLVYSEDTEVLTDACWALSYLSDGANLRIESVLRCSICQRMVELLAHPSPLVQTPALRTIGNIVTGTDAQTQVVIQCGAIPHLLNLLSSPKRTIKKEACWAISNITAGDVLQIQEVINHGLVPPLVQLLATEDFDIKKEAAWALSNAASGGNSAQVEFLVSSSCVKPLCDLLKVNDNKIVVVALEALENILRTGKAKQERDGMDENPYCVLVDQAESVPLVENLQDSPDNIISDKAWRIIYSYFPYEEDPVKAVIDVDPTAPFGAAAPQGGFNFSG